MTPALDTTGTGKRQEASGAALRADMKDDVSVLLQGKRLKINATVDAEGIARLKQVLDKYEEILKTHVRRGPPAGTPPPPGPPPGTPKP